MEKVGRKMDSRISEVIKKLEIMKENLKKKRKEVKRWI